MIFWIDLQVTWANGFLPSANVTKSSVSDVSEVFDSPFELKKTLEKAKYLRYLVIRLFGFLQATCFVHLNKFCPVKLLVSSINFCWASVLSGYCLGTITQALTQKQQNIFIFVTNAKLWVMYIRYIMQLLQNSDESIKSLCSTINIY